MHIFFCVLQRSFYFFKLIVDCQDVLVGCYVVARAFLVVARALICSWAVGYLTVRTSF